MIYSKYKQVYYNELDQKVWRTDTSAGDIPVRYEYVGNMSLPEYELLLEVLFQIFEDDYITLDNFMNYFGDIRTFCDHIKNMVDEA
jgi:hypothetical protein